MSRRDDINRDNYDRDYDNDRDRNYREPKQIKPVIEDDRNKTKPRYVQDEGRKDQYRDSKPSRQDRTMGRTQDYDQSYRQDTYDRERPRAQSKLEPTQQRPQQPQRGYNKDYRNEYQHQNYFIDRVSKQSEQI
jgi:hypothetical protein